MIRQRKPLKRLSEKRSKSGKPFLKRSAIKRSTKPIKKVNVERQAKRKVAYRKMLSGKEYKAARAEAMERAGNQCEMRFYVRDVRNNSRTTIYCEATDNLHAHHLRYPKTRPLEARDLMILCKPHHEEAEGMKMHKTRMF